MYACVTCGSNPATCEFIPTLIGFASRSDPPLALFIQVFNGDFISMDTIRRIVSNTSNKS